MRRLEDKGEDKFWQVERRETTLRISFGKIGHGGQTRIKRCKSESEADDEIETLVAEKIKQGFSEASADDDGEAKAAPAPAAKPAPAPAPAAPGAPTAAAPVAAATPAPRKSASASSSFGSEPSAIDTSARLLERAAPNPGTSRAFKPKPASEPYKRLQDRFAKVSQAIDVAIKSAEPPVAAILRNVQKAYGGEMPETPSEETEAAAYRLFSPPREWRDDHGGELFGRYWVAKAGGELALRALARAGLMSRASDAPNTWTEPKKLWVEDKPHVDTLTWGKSDEVWLPIREWAASLDETGLAKARALVGDLRKNLPATSSRPLLDASIGDPEFCGEDAKEILAAAGAGAPLSVWPALFSMTDPDAMKPTLDVLVAQWGFQHAVDQLPNLVMRLGVRAAPLLVSILTSVAKSGMGSDTTKAVAAAVALVRTPEIAELMADHLGHKDVRPSATEFLQNTPTLAVAPLAAHAVGKGALADLAKSVLGTVVSKAPDAARKIAESLSDHQRALVETALDRFENVIEAEPADLPRVLASPPWIEKRRAATPRSARVKTLAHTPRVVWKNEAQKKQFKNEESYYAPNPAQEKTILKEIDEAAKANKASAVGSYKLMQLPKASAIKTLEEAPLEVFSWYHGNVPTAFIGRYEIDGLKAVLRYATVDLANAIDALAVVDAVDVAPIMADALIRLKKSRQDASKWLLDFAETASISLIPLAVNDQNKTRAKAEQALRYIATHGKRDVVEKVAKKYGADAEAALADVLDYDPLLDYPAKIPRLPGFFSAAALPRPRLRGQKKVLPVSAIETLGTMLAFARIDEPYAGITQVKEACEPASLAELAWELFQAWLVAGAPNKENWAFMALAHLGDDECARKLTPLVRAWPGEAAHARAVVGLDVLAAIGTDVALMHLHGIAQKLKFKGLQEKARAKIDVIAEARGLTAAELADRLVPDLGLEDDGSLELDFGPRKFRVTFDEMLKPAVLDETGKRLPDLPKAKQSDDAEKSAAATAIWKALKKDSKTVASSQLLRLELAMCAQRRWEPEAFDQFFVNHPLLIHLVRRLIWGAYDSKDNLVGSFRIAEDRSYANPKDDRYDLPDGAKIGLVHRLEMKQTDADAWGQVLGDYEIMQPFSQLSREAIRPADDEQTATELVRVTGITVPTGKVLGLDNRGWRRGPPQDGGVVCWYEKPLSDGFVACLDLEPGIYTGMISESPEQKLGKLVVSKNAYSWQKEGLKKLGELSSIEFSELVRDLESVRP
jgi:predicted DNA-binding WGR domain protein